MLRSDSQRDVLADWYQRSCSLYFKYLFSVVETVILQMYNEATVRSEKTWIAANIQESWAFQVQSTMDVYVIIKLTGLSLLKKKKHKGSKNLLICNLWRHGQTEILITQQKYDLQEDAFLPLDRFNYDAELTNKSSDWPYGCNCLCWWRPKWWDTIKGRQACNLGDQTVSCVYLYKVMCVVSKL